MLPLLLFVAQTYTSPYELVAKPEMKQGGIRQYAETSYVYSKVDRAGRKITLWKGTEKEKYANHWISPSGRLWILTQSIAGPGGGGALTVRDEKGGVEGRWPLHTVFQGRPPKDATFEWDAQNRIVGSAGSASVLRTDLAEELYLPFRVGGFVRIVNYRQKMGAPWMGFQAWGRTPKFVEALKDRRASFPTFTAPFAEMPMVHLWTWQVNGKTQNWLQTDLPYGGYEGALRTTTDEKPVDGPPSWTTRTLTGKTVSLESDKGRPVLRIRRMRGSVETVEADLQALTGYRSAKEALANLRLDQMTSFSEGAWRPLPGNGEPAYLPFETLEVFDKQGRRFTFGVDMGPRLTMKAQAFTGLAARRPKEALFANAPYRQSYIFSGNKKLALRIRRFEKSGWRGGFITLVSRVPENGKVVDVELWSGFVGQDEPEMIYVSDTGRVYMYSYHEFDGIPGNASLSISEPDGRQIAGMVMSQRTKFRTAEDIRRIDYKHMVVSYEGKPSEREIDGVKLPYYPVERFVLPVRGGESLVNQISFNSYMKVDTVMYRS